MYSSTAMTVFTVRWKCCHCPPSLAEILFSLNSISCFSMTWFLVPTILLLVLAKLTWPRNLLSGITWYLTFSDQCICFICLFVFLFVLKLHPCAIHVRTFLITKSINRNNILSPLQLAPNFSWWCIIWMLPVPQRTLVLNHWSLAVGTTLRGFGH